MKSKLLPTLLTVGILHATPQLLHGDNTGRTAGRLAPAIIAEQIKVAARETAVQELKQKNGDAAIVKKPLWLVSDDEKTVYYFFGKIKGGTTGFDDRDPYKEVFEKQIQIECIDQVFRGSAPDAVKWQSHLQDAQRIVRQSIHDIESITVAAQLALKLEQRQSEYDQVFARFSNDIVVYAEGKGYKASRESRGLASEGFPVTIVTEPKGGTVRVLTYLMYRKYVILRKPRQKWEWRTLVGDPETMIGGYYYWATWPGGSRSEGRIDVRSDGKKVFRPGPKR